MTCRSISMLLALLAASGVACLAQTPVLSNIQAPYANVQGQVTIGGTAYGSGLTAYGPVGTPLVLTGSDLGASGIVQFVSYKNGGVDSGYTVTVPSANISMWSSSMIFLTVPSGAVSGLVKVTTEAKTSNGLPYLVTNGSYAANASAYSCPAFPPGNQLQITTASLQNGAVNQSYSVTLNATGGTQAYTWSVAGGALPAGLSLNASTGTISGMPTSAVSMAGVTFAVTDSSTPHQTNQALLDLTIEAPGLTSPSGGVYNYTASYDGNGNVTSYTDTVMGTWNFGYDALNRLESGSASAGGTGSQDFVGQNLCWAYDSYGNRTAQVLQTASCPSSESSVTPAIAYTSGNRLPSSIYQYDAAGDVIADNTNGNSYQYDAEGRVCAVKNEPVPGTWTITGYLYDADGIRIAKGTLGNCTSASFASCSCDPTVNGFQITQNYVLGPLGEELSMLDGNNNWQRTNVYAAGRLIGTYDTAGLHFHLEDPLGTRRMQLSGNTNSLGQPETDIQSLPYGDALYSFPDQYAPNTADDATPLHFTGKERDTESGNDYFEARYYSSAMGRFMSPDWSAKEDPVPYAHLDDPQSLNLYAYVLNNPLAKPDLDGHGCPPDCSTGNPVVDFFDGAANAWSSDNALGAGRNNQSSGSGQMGQAFGDAGAAIQGAGEALLGSGGEVVGAALDATGVGALAGVPVNVASAVVIAHGTTTAVVGGAHLAKDASQSSSGTTPSSAGKMQKEVEKGQAPKTVDRVDKGRGPNEKDHVHFTDGSARNQDGTWKHGLSDLSNKVKDWLGKHGWN